MTVQSLLFSCIVMLSFWAHATNTATPPPPAVESVSAEVTALDKTLSKLLVSPATNQSALEIENAAVQRVHRCDINPTQCKPLSDLQGLCADNSVPESINRFWSAILRHIKAPITASSILSKCSKGMNQGKLVGYLSAITFYEKNRDATLRDNLLAELGKEKYPASASINEALKQYHLTVSNLMTLKPLPLDVIWTLTSHSLAAAQNAKPLDMSQPVVGLWIAMLGDVLAPMGQEERFISLLEVHPEIDKTKNFWNRFSISLMVCNYARQRNKFRLCEEQIKGMKSLPEASQEAGKNAITFVEATNRLYSGDKDGGLTDLRNLAKGMNAKDPMTPWIHLMLGIAYIHNRDFKSAEVEVKKHIELLPKTANAMNSFMGPGTLQSIYIEQNKFAEAEAIMTGLKKNMESTVRGSFESLAWAEFNNLFLSIKKKDNAGASAALSELNRHVAKTPLYSYLTFMSQALLDRSKNLPVDLVPLKKTVGDKHYEVQHLERLLFKLKD